MKGILTVVLQVLNEWPSAYERIGLGGGSGGFGGRLAQVPCLVDSTKAVALGTPFRTIVVDEFVGRDTAGQRFPFIRHIVETVDHVAH